MVDGYGALKKMNKRRNKTSPKLKYAVDWLVDYLGGNSIPARQCIAAAKQKGITPRTLQRAKDNLWVICLWRGRHWEWSNYITTQEAYLAAEPECHIKLNTIRVDGKERRIE